MGRGWKAPPDTTVSAGPCEKVVAKHVKETTL